jgi:hypothetical protein
LNEPNSGSDFPPPANTPGVKIPAPCEPNFLAHNRT